MTSKIKIMKIKIKLTFLVVLFLSINNVCGQTIKNITVTGTLQFEKEVSSNDIYIHLIETNNKTIVKTEIPNAEGHFKFNTVASNTYYIEVLVNSELKYKSQPFETTTNIELGNIEIKRNQKVLDEVVVATTKPYLERKDGKTILNVESAIGSAGASAFDLIERAPGVNVDTNDNISLRGKTGILVQIDGKQTAMTGASLANYLKGISSNTVDKIEFITNPSAKYDAAGSSIINIKLKKGKKSGTNGSISSVYGQGRYPTSNNSINLNHGAEKFNLFGSYNFTYREGINKLLLNRRFFQNDVFTKSYEQDNFLKINYRYQTARFGADYSPNKKHTFGFISNLFNNNYDPFQNNSTNVYDSSNSISSRFNTKNNSKENRKNYSVNLNHRFVIDTLGTEWTSDFDHANYDSKTHQNFTTRYFNLNNIEFQNPYLLKGDIQGDLNIYALKSDFVTSFKNKIKLETGIKSSFVKADNNLGFYDMSSGIPVFDTTKSNHFIYDENINAAYLITSKEFKKWMVNLGLRIENTNIKGNQITNNSKFKDSYVQLFPTGILSYNFNEKNSLEFNYSRRITRPSYDQLNPFKFYLDPTTYKEGNPLLKPQTTQNFELTYTYNQKLTTTLGFGRTTNNITEVIAPSDANPLITVQTDKNLNTVDVLGLFTSIPLNIAKWWTINNSLNFYYGWYSGTVANTTLNNTGNLNFNFNSVNNIKMGKGYSAEFTGDYRAREIYAFMNVNPLWYLNIGFQKTFENKSKVRVTLNDVFYTNKTTADTEFLGYKERFNVSRDTRVLILSYTYNFGNGTNSVKKKTGGAEDIKQRANS